ncbi:MAG: hypothetical protein ACFFDU_01540 [Candidatus Thorarchaeota archaeon]
MVKNAALQIQPTDVGSFPLVGIDLKQYIRGAVDLEDGRNTEAATYFIHEHNAAFIQKMAALGSQVSVPCYVQSSIDRDMLSQFLDPIVRHGKGLQKEADTYLWDGTPIRLPPERAQVAEMLALQQGAKTICQEFEIDAIEYRACITGPFEMASRLWRSMGINLRYDEALIEAFTTIVQSYMKNAQIQTKYLQPHVMTLDEPSIGVTGVGDLFTDTKTDPHLSHLLTNWNRIFSVIPSHQYRGLHLHASPYHQLASADWNLLEAHLGVIVSKTWLIDNDKFLRAAVMRTEGPTIPDTSDLRYAWDQIQSGAFHPYIQAKEEMMHYLQTAVNRYGLDRIPFAGPECGLGSWNWKYGDDMALTSLKRLHQIVMDFTKTI